jgi:hypothetical protein
MKTLEEIRRSRDQLRKRLRAAYEAAAASEQTILVSKAARARFEEACRPPAATHAVTPRAGSWVRC